MFVGLSANNEHIISHNAHNKPMMLVILLQMRKLRQRDIMYFAQCHAALNSKTRV